MSLYRKFASLAAALILTLSLAGSAFAATSQSATSESLSVADTITMVAPASHTYVNDNAGEFEAPQEDITVIGSNASAGLTVAVQASAFAGPGSISVAPTNRFVTHLANSAAGSGAVLNVVGTRPGKGAFATPTTSVTLASATGPVAGRSFSITWDVDSTAFTVGGSYTGTLSYTATTN